MLLRYWITLVIILIGGWSTLSHANTPQEGEYIHACQLTTTDLASPESIWAWATRAPAEEGDFYDNEMEAAILIWHRFGKDALKPYKKSEGVAGITAGAKGQINKLIGAGTNRGDGLTFLANYKYSYETDRQKKQRKQSEKTAKALRSGDVSSKNYPEKPQGNFLSFAFSRLGDCYIGKFPGRYRVDDYQFELGPFPASLCDAAYAKGVNSGQSLADQTAIRRWRGDYRSRKSDGAQQCAYLPSIFANDPALSGQMKTAMTARTSKLYDQSRLNSASYCFAGVRPNPTLDMMMNSPFWTLRDRPNRNATQDAIESLDPGDNRITQRSVSAAYELWKFYRGGEATLRAPMYLHKCHSSIETFYCGFPKSREADRIHINRNNRKADVRRALIAAMPSQMTEHTKEFIRQNLGDCALEPENMTPLTVIKTVNYEPRPKGQCLALETHLLEQVKAGRIHQDDRAWLLKWRAKNAQGQAQCVNDFPWEAMKNLRDKWKADARQAAYAQYKRNQAAEAAAEAAAYRARYNAALYGNRAGGSSAPAPRSARQIENDIIRWENYKEAQRCSNPTATGC